MKKTLQIVLVGAPGSGKGTQATQMSAHLNIPQISTGDIFRFNIKNNTPLGQQIKQYLDRGQLVPDEVVLNIVKDRLCKDDCKNGFILDGFPRTEAQAVAFDSTDSIDCAILLEVEEQKLMDRLTGRRTCKGCGAIHHISSLNGKDVCPVCGGELFVRDDDKPETVTNRLKVYREETMPIVEHYSKQGKLISINSNQSPQKVFEDIIESLNKLC